MKFLSLPIVLFPVNFTLMFKDFVLRTSEKFGQQKEVLGRVWMEKREGRDDVIIS